MATKLSEVPAATLLPAGVTAIDCRVTPAPPELELLDAPLELLEELPLDELPLDELPLDELLLDELPLEPLELLLLLPPLDAPPLDELLLDELLLTPLEPLLLDEPLLTPLEPLLLDVLPPLLLELLLPLLEVLPLLLELLPLLEVLLLEVLPLPLELVEEPLLEVELPLALLEAVPTSSELVLLPPQADSARTKPTRPIEASEFARGAIQRNNVSAARAITRRFLLELGVAAAQQDRRILRHAGSHGHATISAT